MRVPVLTISALCWLATADPTRSEDVAGGDGTTWTASAPGGGESAAAVHPRRSELIRGLFGVCRRNRKHPRDRVTDRPVDAEDVAAGGRVNATDDNGGGGGETATTAGPDRIVFGTEDECTTATGDERRPCVCHTVDYLDWIAQRLDDAVAGNDPVAARAFDCQSYKAVPTAFVVRPAADANRPRPDESRPPSEDDGSLARGAVAARAEVEPVEVIGYRLDVPADDHFTIHYELLGSDVKLRCLTNGTDVKAYKWDFETGKHKTNSTIIGNNTINLSILGLEPADSKNYTCTPETDDAKNAKTNNSYRHYVIAVSNPVYEIRGTAVYKTSGSSVCTRENVEPVRKQLPNFVRAELCPEGSTRYACNIVIEPPKCAEDQCFSTGTISPRWVMKEYRGAKTLEIKLLVTFNEKAGFLNRIRTSRRGRNALCYQQALARILKVLAANLNKTLTVEIVSKFSLIDTHFESDRGRTKVKTFVACAPGFGIREVFCGACPPHHYSANVSADCLKCPKGFHQPVAGSNKCLKCPHPFASGCYMREVPSYIFYVTILVIFLVFGVFVASCLCCCREENEKNIRIIPRNIRRKFKRSKGYDLM